MSITYEKYLYKKRTFFAFLFTKASQCPKIKIFILLRNDIAFWHAKSSVLFEILRFNRFKIFCLLDLFIPLYAAVVFLITATVCRYVLRKIRLFVLNFNCPKFFLITTLTKAKFYFLFSCFYPSEKRLSKNFYAFFRLANPKTCKIRREGI